MKKPAWLKSGTYVAVTFLDHTTAMRTSTQASPDNHDPIIVKVTGRWLEDGNKVKLLREGKAGHEATARFARISSWQAGTNDDTIHSVLQDAIIEVQELVPRRKWLLGLKKS